MTTTLGSSGPLHVDDLPEDGPRHSELIDGSLYVTPADEWRHQALVVRLVQLLQALAPDGVLVLPEVNLLQRKPEGDRYLIPDVVALRRDLLVGGDPVHVDPEASELVVEVLSPSTRRVDQVLKRRLYAEWVIPAYVIVDPTDRSVTWLVLDRDGIYQESTPHGDPRLERWRVPFADADLWDGL